MYVQPFIAEFWFSAPQRQASVYVPLGFLSKKYALIIPLSVQNMQSIFTKKILKYNNNKDNFFDKID